MRDKLLEWGVNILLIGFAAFIAIACVGSEVQCLVTGDQSLCPHLVKVHY